MEQRGAPAALRKVQQPQAHWFLCMGIEPEEKLERKQRRSELKGDYSHFISEATFLQGIKDDQTWGGLEHQVIFA